MHTSLIVLQYSASVIKLNGSVKPNSYCKYEWLSLNASLHVQASPFVFVYDVLCYCPITI